MFMYMMKLKSYVLIADEINILVPYMYACVYVYIVCTYVCMYTLYVRVIPAADFVLTIYGYIVMLSFGSQSSVLCLFIYN